MPGVYRPKLQEFLPTFKFHTVLFYFRHTGNRYFSVIGRDFLKLFIKLIILSLEESIRVKMWWPLFRKRNIMERLDQGHLHPKLEVSRLICPGRELNPGLHGGRRAF
jgi:hypothetical protein